MLKFSQIIISLVIGSLAYAQVNYFALITEPQIGAEDNALNLINAVEDINRRGNVTNVIVLGNITAGGKFDEFIWAQEILDGLNVPYFVVGGENDYLLSDGKGSEISMLWEDDKKIFDHENYKLICLNTILPEYPGQNHIEVETFSWLENSLKNSNAKRIITISYYPIYQADNSQRFFEATLNCKLFSFVSKDDKPNKEIPSHEGFYLNRKNDWGYLLISVKNDTVLIKKMLGEEIIKKTKPEVIKYNFSSISLYESIKPLKVFSSANELWTIDLDKTILVKPALLSDKIISGFKDGSVISLKNSGKQVWNYETNGMISIPPLTDKELLLTATTEGDIFTLNGTNGNLVQVIGIGETITSNIALLNIEDNNSITKAFISGTASGNLYCYNLHTLIPIWINNDASNQINSIVCTDDNTVIYQDKEGILYCVSASNGLLLWIWKAQVKNFNSEFKSDIIESKNSIYLIHPDGTLHCIDALLGTSKWNIKKTDFLGIIRIDPKGQLVLPALKNKILHVSPKLGKVTSEIELPFETEGTEITDLRIIGDNIFIGFSDGWVYKVKPKHKPGKFFRGGSAPIVSILEVDGNCLVTDYDGKYTLLNTSQLDND